MLPNPCQIPVHAKQVILCVNPKAGRQRRAEPCQRLAELLTDRGFSPLILGDLDEIARVAAESLSQGTLRAVVAAGGDGTVAELLNRTPVGCPLAVFPLGSENLLARYLGQQGTPEALLETIVSGQAFRFDAGRAAGRLFLLMASVGFDAEVVRQVHEARDGNITRLHWLKPLWRSIRSYSYPRLRIYWQPAPDSAVSPRDGAGEEQAEVRWIFGFNVPRYALGLQFAPQALAWDGLLDVCGFERGSFWSGLRYLAGVLTGKHLGWPDCRHFRCRRLRIEADQPVAYQLDGDAGGWLPLEIDMAPERALILVPPVFAAAHVPPEPTTEELLEQRLELGLGPATAGRTCARVEGEC